MQPVCPNYEDSDVGGDVKIYTDEVDSYLASYVYAAWTSN